MKSKQEVKIDEIDLIKLIQAIWLRKLVFIKTIGVFSVLGLVIAFTSPEEYQTSCTLIPEAMAGDGQLGGSLSGLASLAGVDLGNVANGTSINPGLYRSVAQSTPFLLELMRRKFYFDDLGKELSIYEYYSNFKKYGLVSRLISYPYILISLLRSNEELLEDSYASAEFISLTEEELKVANDLKSRMLVTMDWDLNVVTIEVEFQNARVAAEMTSFTQEYITNYVTEYSISKSKEQLRYVEEQYINRKKEFEEIQIVLARFSDRNKNVNTAEARSEEQRLQSDYNIAFGIYDQLARQREKIKLQINQNTPVFTVLEPVKIPVENSKPNKLIIIIISLLAGLAIGFGIVLFKPVFSNIS